MTSGMKQTRFAAGLFVWAPLLLALFFSGCEHEPEWKKNEFKKHALVQSSNDAKLPEALWNQIEAVYTGKVEASGEPGEKKVETAPPDESPGSAKSVTETGTLPTEFVPLKVYLIEKNRGLLHGQNHLIEFGPGGGELDLQDFVEPKSGSFYLAVEFKPDVPVEKENDPAERVFFLSNSVRRKLGTEVIGNGCHDYFDVTTAFQKAMRGPGFYLNTTRLRHVSALAGTFFFALKHEGKLYLAQLTIKDSGARSLLCRH
jgi:hypothetical protein